MKLGKLEFDTTEFASRANAVLGIRDSGKSYTATLLAEQLLDSTALAGAGIPFIAFDPPGIWRFLRVKGKGKGYPVVVVGGIGADLPLKAATVGKIVEAALRGHVSLVIDLSGDISKGDMRRIVTDCVGVLMAKNSQYGLRHVFLEEAAEFVPQKVRDTIVYAAVEKLVRVGGNMGLGVTLINPRTQNLNKEVLELCDNIFLHRQRGKNSLENLKEWFDAVGVDVPKELATEVSSLQSGECFAWLRDATGPERVKVQAKNSFHPNRRDLQAAGGKKAPKIDADEFVEALKTALPQVEAEMQANDPALLRAEVAKLKAELAKKPSEALAKEPAKKDKWFNDGVAAGQRQADRQLAAMKRIVESNAATTARKISAVLTAMKRATDMIHTAVKMVEEGSAAIRAAADGVTFPELDAELEKMAKALPTLPPPTPGITQRVVITNRAVPVQHRGNGAAPSPEAKEAVGAAIRILGVLASRYPARFTMGQWAALAGMKKSGGTWGTYVSRLRQAGYLDEAGGTIAASEAGVAASGATPGVAQTREEIVAQWKESLGSGPAKMMDVLMSAYPEGVTRDDLAAAMDPPMAAGGGTFGTYLSRLVSNLVVVSDRTTKSVKMSPTIMEA